MKRLLNVDLFDILDFLRPMKVTALDLNFDAQIRCRRNISVYAQGSVSVTSEVAEVVQALGWCPGPVVFPLYLYLLTPYKQHQLIPQIWDILHNDFLSVPEMSDMDVNRSEAPYHSGRGFWCIISDNDA